MSLSAPNLDQPFSVRLLSTTVDSWKIVQKRQTNDDHACSLPSTDAMSSVCSIRRHFQHNAVEANKNNSTMFKMSPNRKLDDDGVCPKKNEKSLKNKRNSKKFQSKLNKIGKILAQSRSKMQRSTVSQIFQWPSMKCIKAKRFKRLVNKFDNNYL